MADVKRLPFGGPFPISVSGTPTFGNFTINSGGGSIDRVAWVMQLPADTWTHIGFRYGARALTPVAHKAGLQGVTTGGLPDGTYLGGGTPASGSFTPPASTAWDGTWQWVALDNSYTSTEGQFVAPVIEPTGTPDATNNSSFTQGLTNAWVVRAGLPYNMTQTDAATFARVPARIPIVALKSASRVVGLPMQSLFATTIGTNGNRQALKFTIPAGAGDTFKVRGLRFVGRTPATGNNFKVALWDGAGTELAGISVDSDFSGQIDTAYTQYEVFFDDTLTALNCGTAYYCGLERVDATNTILYGVTVASAADLAAYPGGTDWFLSTWNGSAWSDDTTTRPMAELILDDFTEPAGGSGGVMFHPGMQGGMAS